VGNFQDEAMGEEVEEKSRRDSNETGKWATKPGNGLQLKTLMAIRDFIGIGDPGLTTGQNGRQPPWDNSPSRTTLNDPGFKSWGPGPGSTMKHPPESPLCQRKEGTRVMRQSRDRGKKLRQHRLETD